MGEAICIDQNGKGGISKGERIEGVKCEMCFTFYNDILEKVRRMKFKPAEDVLLRTLRSLPCRGSRIICELL